MVPMLTTLLIYISINLFVNQRLNKAFYLSEEMRKLHKKFIWFLPFLGPLVIRNFWKKPTTKLDPINTKVQRDKNATYDGFYESGQGIM